MSYTKTTWQTGDVVTAAKLNNMESGIENAGGNYYAFYNGNEDDGYTCDRTYAEIKAAFDEGKNVVAVLYGYALHLFSVQDGEFSFITNSLIENNGYIECISMTLYHAFVDDTEEIEVTNSDMAISLAPLMVGYNTSTSKLSETFETIFNALTDGKPVYMIVNVGTIDSYEAKRGKFEIVCARKYDNAYRVYAIQTAEAGGSSYTGKSYVGKVDMWTFSCASADSLPELYAAVTTKNDYIYPT